MLPKFFRKANTRRRRDCQLVPFKKNHQLFLKVRCDEDFLLCVCCVVQAQRGGRPLEVRRKNINNEYFGLAGARESDSVCHRRYDRLPVCLLGCGRDRGQTSTVESRFLRTRQCQTFHVAVAVGPRRTLAMRFLEIGPGASSRPHCSWTMRLEDVYPGQVPGSHPCCF